MVTVKEMKELERMADQAGLSYLQMMENAGAAAVDALLREKPGIHTAAIFCGKGNNGGDGFVIARLLRQKGVGVLLILSEGKPTTPDAMTNFLLAIRMDIPLVFGIKLTQEDIDWIQRCDVVIDGMIGTGFHGELRLETDVCCGVFNRAHGLKLALDVPSGVNADTGEIANGSVKADLTVAFHERKGCHESASPQCGKVVVADIGISAALAQK